MLKHQLVYYYERKRVGCRVCLCTEYKREDLWNCSLFFLGWTFANFTFHICFKKKNIFFHMLLVRRLGKGYSSTFDTKTVFSNLIFYKYFYIVWYLSMFKQYLVQFWYFQVLFMIYINIFFCAPVPLVVFFSINYLFLFLLPNWFFVLYHLFSKLFTLWSLVLIIILLFK